MKEKIEVYNLDDIEIEHSFGMEIKVCEKLGHFDNKVALEYIYLKPNTIFKPHYHSKSNALIFILRGQGYITDVYGNKYKIRESSLAYFPAKTKHGFITKEEPIVLVTVQSPPIKNLITGEEDFIEE